VKFESLDLNPVNIVDRVFCCPFINLFDNKRVTEEAWAEKCN